MVDSKEKGARAESKVRDELRKHTGHDWQRVPLSGALDARLGLKGDIFIPNKKNIYCIEVKHYKDDHLNSKVLTGKNPQLIEWWEQAIREAKQTHKKPLLIFKHDRSKIFVAFEEPHLDDGKFLNVNYNKYNFYICLLDDFLKLNIEWIE